MKIRVIFNICLFLFLFLILPIDGYSQEINTGLNGVTGISSDKPVFGFSIHFELYTSTNFGIGLYTGLYQIGTEWANYDIIMPFMIYFIPRFSFKSLPNIYFPVLIGGGYNRNSIYSSLIDYSFTLIGTGIQWKIHDKFGFRAIITYDILPKIIYKLEIGGFIYINTQVEENQELNSNKNPVDLNIDLYLSHFYGTPFDDYEYLFSLGGSLEVVYTFFDFIGAGIQISYIDFFNNQVRSIFSTKLNINLETGTYQGFSIMIKGSFGILSYLGFFQDINELLDFGFGLRYMINEYISIRSQVLYCMGLGSFVEMKVQTGIVINL